MSKHIDNLLWLMKNKPDEFKVTQHTLNHIPSKAEYWIGNDVQNYGLYSPEYIKFCPEDQKEFACALEEMRVKRMDIARKFLPIYLEEPKDEATTPQQTTDREPPPDAPA